MTDPILRAQQRRAKHREEDIKHHEWCRDGALSKLGWWEDQLEYTTDVPQSYWYIEMQLQEKLAAEFQAKIDELRGELLAEVV